MLFRTLVISVRWTRLVVTRNVEVYGISEVLADAPVQVPPYPREILKGGIVRIDVYRPGISRIRIREMPGLPGGFEPDSRVTRFEPSK